MDKINNEKTMIMQNPIISIIVPCYNVELYLKQCVESILKQTYTNWELILVDDGSKDRTPQLCDHYATMDARIKVIHKANGGLVSARNTGYEAVTGDWMTYLDGDDWVSLDMVEKLTLAISKMNGLDMIFWCVTQMLVDKPILNKWNWEQYTNNKIYNKSECLELSSYVLNYNSGISDAVCKLLRTEWCRKHDIKHDSRLKQGEESVDFVMRAFYYADKALFMREYMYNYRYNASSISKRVDENNALCIIGCMNVMNQFINTIPNNSKFKKEFSIRNAYVMISIAMQTYFNPNNHLAYKIRKNRYKKLISDTPLFIKAVKNVNSNEFDILRCITWWCIRHKYFFMIELIARIKYYALKLGIFGY